MESVVGVLLFACVVMMSWGLCRAIGAAHTLHRLDRLREKRATQLLRRTRMEIVA